MFINNIKKVKIEKDQEKKVHSKRNKICEKGKL